MTIFMLVATIGIPSLMVYLQQKGAIFRLLFNILGVIAAILFSTIAATAITNIILEDAVFMTTIHAVFLNPVFLITGAYLGLYLIYRLIMMTIQERD
ncbi:transposase [Lysinibacillus fusiformis]|uniref:transposase n=1 Tax=Lysinibacillus fusiformis TaxID=28031 RepID=UPI0019677000|nr:transposase [Lysinibacillus fusiformis]QSB09143.1 transposase [Lysinibacillus fusiformis]